jgi:hypothetical protein
VYGQVFVKDGNFSTVIWSFWKQMPMCRMDTVECSHKNFIHSRDKIELLSPSRRISYLYILCWKTKSRLLGLFRLIDLYLRQICSFNYLTINET